MGKLTKTKRIIKFSTFTLITLLGLFSLVATFLTSPVVKGIVSPINSTIARADSRKSQYEIFGFAPYWNLGKLDNVDFSTLTTLAYFGVPINSDGSLDEENIGYQKLQTQDATDLFAKAKQHGTKVVLTVTIMDASTIEALLNDLKSQDNAIKKISQLVKEKNMNGVNIDIEYIPDPGDKMRSQFTDFVKHLTNTMHSKDPNSYITVSVLATSAKYPKLYDIGALSKVSDGIFMMAYDFATSSSNKAMPTAPLYGYKEGKYWYDISTAVDDFLKVMPANKLVLGLPWYGYDYPVYSPSTNAKRDQGYSYWYKVWTSRYRYVWRLASYAPESFVQTYTNGTQNVAAVQTGWDNAGKVSWKAYKDGDTWRMYFLEDKKSLSIKYDFAKQKNLGGVGIWALGFDSGTNDMWNLLSVKFGPKLADAKTN